MLIFFPYNANIKTIFEKKYNVRSRGLMNMIKTIKEKFEGRQHSGIVDCHNTAKIMIKMVKDGLKKENIYVNDVSYKYKNNKDNNFKIIK